MSIDDIYRQLHGENEAAHAQGAADREAGWRAPATFGNGSNPDAAYWYREGFHGRPFEPLTSPRDCLRIATKWDADETNRED